MHAKTLRTLVSGALFGGVAFGCAASSATSPLAADEDDGKGGSAASAGDDGKGGSGNTTSTGGVSGTAATTGGTSGTSSTTGGTGSSTGGSGSTTGGASGTGSTMPPPGRPTIPLPYTDDFETSMAADWRFITPDGWGVSDDGGNQVLLQKSQNSDSKATWAIGGDRNWTDVKVEMRVKFVSGDGMILLSPRWKDLDNYYFVEYEMEDKPKLRRRLNGSTADIVTSADTLTFTVGQWHTVSVTLSGTSASLSFDGTEIGTGTDETPVPSGGIGIATEDCIVAIDDVSVTAP
jgi:hypothetical protein